MSLREGAGVACKDSWGPSLRHAGIPGWEAKESGPMLHFISFIPWRCPGHGQRVVRMNKKINERERNQEKR